MSTDKLLNESTIRRFMKLANMEPLAESFVGRVDERCMDHDDMAYEAIEEEAAEEMEDAVEDMEAAADEMEEEEAEMEEEEAEAEEEEAEEEAEDLEAALEGLLVSMLDGLQDKLRAAGFGHLLDVEADEEADADMAADEIDMEVAADDMDYAADDMEVAAEEEMELMEEPVIEEQAEETVTEEVTTEEVVEETVEEMNAVDDEELINEVAKRVTARLVKAVSERK